MTIRKKNISFDADLDIVRELLLEIFRKNGFLSYLIPTKIENHRFGPCGPPYSEKDNNDIIIWGIEDENGTIKTIAVSHRGGAANYHIEILPHYKSLEKEIFLELENDEKTIRNNNKASCIQSFALINRKENITQTITVSSKENQLIIQPRYSVSQGLRFFETTLQYIRYTFIFPLQFTNNNSQAITLTHSLDSHLRKKEEDKWIQTH